MWDVYPLFGLPNYLFPLYFLQKVQGFWHISKSTYKTSYNAACVLWLIVTRRSNHASRPCLKFINVSWRYNPLWLYFHSPVTGFSRLIFEVTWAHTQRRATVGRTPLGEWSIRHRDLYLTTHNAHNRQTSMPLVGFKPTISADERPKTYALDRAATGTGKFIYVININKYKWVSLPVTTVYTWSKSVIPVLFSLGTKRR